MKLIKLIEKNGNLKSYRPFCMTCNEFLMNRYVDDYSAADLVRKRHEVEFPNHLTRMVIRVSSFE